MRFIWQIVYIVLYLWLSSPPHNRGKHVVNGRIDAVVVFKLRNGGDAPDAPDGDLEADISETKFRPCR